MFKAIPKEIRDQIIQRIKNEGVSVPQAAKDAGISPKTIYSWLSGRTYASEPGQLEIFRLKKENQSLYELVGKLTVELSNQKKKRGI